MKKLIGAAVASGILTSLATLSIATAADTTPLTIAYIQKQGDQQYFVDEATGAKDEAKALGNVKVDVVNVQMDANAAISAMNVMVGQKVNGIAIVVPDQQIGPQVIDMANGASIPLVSSDDPIKSGTGSVAPFVGFDGYQMGYKVGQAAGMFYKTAGWAPDTTRVAAAYEQQLSVCADRQKGEEEGFAAAAGTVPTIIKIGTDNSVVDAQNRTSAVVTANPQIKHWVVWGCNDENETGAVTALTNAGMTPDGIIGVGLGAYLTCKDWQAGQTSGNKAALFISGHDVGSAAVKALVESIRNKTPLPAKTIATTTIVTPANWKAVMGSCS
ncbi:substrate-binding domain-containing protein [Acidisoma cladoniae]|jgi:L-arabinose transport system substrate-binding protein|uniref:substrate-binding domain-containing protein n=1 Tax=Acidisoma cladoniae TaxID=3040935 RepID=UPI00254C4994|nr:substrate-binding domain-containing protein [Acidisoma sp. PAMC 29798]